MPRQDHDDLKSQSYRKKERNAAMSMEREENERNKEIEEGKRKAGIQMAKLMLKNRLPAISGQGGNQHTFGTVCLITDTLGHLTQADLFEALRDWNKTCVPPWEDAELKAIIDSAFKFSGPPRSDLMGKVEKQEAEQSRTERAAIMERIIASEDHMKMKPTNPKDAVGIKKPRFYSGMSAHVDRLVGLGLFEGAMKYGRHNYRPAAVRASVYYDATREHLASFWEGEDVDPDSKLPHVIKAICSLYVLADAIITGNLVDDRPPRTVNPRALANKYQPVVDELFRKYPNPKDAFTNSNSTTIVAAIDANPFLSEIPVNTPEEK